ncbi:MAG: HAMP domain-containing sensor histidine kinase [Erysipelotrichaceae bacterium]|nr:HAMP domain-containing sensor histidine kinase [Erysipelotrichaceae bacterium]
MKKKFSLRMQVTVILFVFVAAVLGLIYIFQTVYLNDFYSSEKKSLLKNIANNVAETIALNESSDFDFEYGMSNEVCIRTVSNVDKYNNDCHCSLKDMNVDTINEIASQTIDAGGDKLFDQFVYISRRDGVRNDLYIYAKYLTVNEDVVLVMVSSMITPLDITISTIKSQYLVIVGIVIIMTLILAFLISRIILKPVKDMNSESKKLAKGQYDGSLVKTNSQEFDELNDTLIQANEDILAADTARKELIGNVSHDLRTPLTMIVGYGEMMKDIPEENNEENIDIIINEAKRLSALVDDMLMVSKLELGHLELNRKKINARTLLDNVFHQYEKYCESMNVDISLDMEEDFDFMADENRIEQVLYNFINNALNYNSKEDQKIIIGTKKNGDSYRIYVHDNGDGIAEDDKDKIWERYYKVDKEHKRPHIGSGIGLSLCRQILEVHEFNYGVDSSPGEYSEFYFDVHNI